MVLQRVVYLAEPRAGSNGRDAPDTDIARMGVTSMTTPWVEECPAKECPPLRIAISSPCRRANEIASEMSSGIAHDTMPAG